MGSWKTIGLAAPSRSDSEVRLEIANPRPRCVMTTLPQGNLPKDPSVLRTIVQHNQGNVGVLATVIKVGRVAAAMRQLRISWSSRIDITGMEATCFILALMIVC